MHVVVLYAPCMFVYRRRFFVTFDLNTRPAGSHKKEEEEL